MTIDASIVIPLKRQRDAWLEQCVRSALEQTAPCETLVVHAADTPASNLALLHRLAQSCDSLRVLLEDKPGSFPGALNLGIRSARGARVGFLLSDDWLDPEAVACCLAVDADIVSTGHTIYYADGVTLQPRAGLTPSPRRYQKLATLEAKASYLEHFFLFRKEALLRAGGLDESIGNFPGIDDYDLIWTLLEHGASVGLVERRLYNYRDHEGERLTLADAAQASRNLEKILRKHGVEEAAIPELMAVAARWFGRPIYRVLEDEAQ